MESPQPAITRAFQDLERDYMHSSDPLEQFYAAYDAFLDYHPHPNPLPIGRIAYELPHNLVVSLTVRAEEAILIDDKQTLHKIHSIIQPPSRRNRKHASCTWESVHLLDLIGLFHVGRGGLTRDFVTQLSAAQKQGYRAQDVLPRVREMAEQRRKDTVVVRLAHGMLRSRGQPPRFRSKDVRQAVEKLKELGVPTSLPSATNGPPGALPTPPQTRERPDTSKSTNGEDWSAKTERAGEDDENMHDSGPNSDAPMDIISSSPPIEMGLRNPPGLLRKSISSTHDSASSLGKALSTHNSPSFQDSSQKKRRFISFNSDGIDTTAPRAKRLRHERQSSLPLGVKLAQPIFNDTPISWRMPAPDLDSSPKSVATPVVSLSALHLLADSAEAASRLEETATVSNAGLRPVVPATVQPITDSATELQIGGRSRDAVNMQPAEAGAETTTEATVPAKAPAKTVESSSQPPDTSVQIEARAKTAHMESSSKPGDTTVQTGAAAETAPVDLPSQPAQTAPAETTVQTQASKQTAHVDLTSHPGDTAVQSRAPARTEAAGSKSQPTETTLALTAPGQDKTCMASTQPPEESSSQQTLDILLSSQVASKTIDDVLPYLVPPTHHIVDCSATQSSSTSPYRPMAKKQRAELPDLVVPMGDDKHWILAIISPTDNKCRVFDSLRAKKYTLEPFRRRLRSFFRRLPGGEENDAWTIEIDSNCAQQDDSTSCGVFVLINALLYTTELTVVQSLHRIDPALARSVLAALFLATPNASALKKDDMALRCDGDFLSEPVPLPPLPNKLRNIKQQIKELQRMEQQRQQYLERRRQTLVGQNTFCTTLKNVFEHRLALCNKDNLIAQTNGPVASLDYALGVLGASTTETLNDSYMMILKEAFGDGFEARCAEAQRRVETQRKHHFAVSQALKGGLERVMSLVVDIEREMRVTEDELGESMV